MADQITNYKCPACTGSLHFVGASGKLECDYCGSSYSVEEIEAIVRGETELDAALSARITAIQKEKAALDRAGEIAGRLRQAHAQFRTLDARPYLDEMQTERVLERDTLPKEHFPWQRFFARLLDGQIYRTLWMLLLPALGFNMLKNSRGGMLFLELLTLGTMFLLEPLLLSRFGTTPGKWLFGLRVTSPDGRKLTYAEGRERTAYLFWYGIRLNLPVFRLYRLYVSYTDEQQGKALPWEDGSKQTIRDHAGWRFAAAAVFAALLIAGGVLRVLLPVGPVYRGELTVAQFAENYNRIQRQLGDAGIELDENGRWKEESSFQSNGGTTTVMFNHRLPQLEYQTENGVLTGIVYHAEGGEADSWISIPSGSVMQYALFAFAGAEKGHILLDKPPAGGCVRAVQLRIFRIPHRRGRHRSRLYLYRHHNRFCADAVQLYPHAAQGAGVTISALARQHPGSPFRGAIFCPPCPAGEGDAKCSHKKQRNPAPECGICR